MIRTQFQGKDWFHPTVSSTSSQEHNYDDFVRILEQQIKTKLKIGKHSNRSSNLKILDNRMIFDSYKCIIEKHAFDSMASIGTVDGDYLPFLTFHCTQNINKVNSIIKYGYIIPGHTHPTKGYVMRMENGRFYGDGIYSTSEIDIAQWFSFIDRNGGVSVIINIVFPGKCKLVEPFAEWNKKTKYEKVIPPHIGDCYMDPDGTYNTLHNGAGIWVSSSSERIVPVAVIKLDPNFNDELVEKLADSAHYKMYDGCKKFAHEHYLDKTYVLQTFPLTDTISMVDIIPEISTEHYAPKYLAPINGELSGRFERFKTDIIEEKKSAKQGSQEKGFYEMIDAYVSMVPIEFLHHIVATRAIEKKEEVKRIQKIKRVIATRKSSNKAKWEKVEIACDKKPAPGDPKVRSIIMFPKSLIFDHSLTKSIDSFTQTLNSERHYAIYGETCQIKNTGNLTSHIGRAKPEKDMIIPGLESVINMICKSNDNYAHLDIVYIVVNMPSDLISLSAFYEKWEKYTKVKNIIFKIIFIDKVYEQVLHIKSKLQTIFPYESLYYSDPNYETMFDLILEENDEIENVSKNSIRVPYPLGVVGDGFLTTLNELPYWDTMAVDTVLYKGKVPECLKYNTHWYKTQQIDQLSTDQVCRMTDCVISILARFRLFAFEHPHRAYYQKKMLEDVTTSVIQKLDSIDLERVALSSIKGAKYYIMKLWSDIVAWSKIDLTSKWFTSLKKMKYSKNIIKRSKFDFDIDSIRKHTRKVIKEPSDALVVLPLHGTIQFRTVQTSASEIEPWNIIVPYVSPDATKRCSIKFYHDNELDKKIIDSSGRKVTDLFVVDRSDVAKMWLAYTFTRNPYLYIPEQRIALISTIVVSSLEQIFRMVINKKKYNMDYSVEEVTGLVEKVHVLIPELVVYFEKSSLMNNLDMIFVDENIEQYITTIYGVSSVIKIIASLFTSRGKKIFESDKLPRFCFAIMAESVMRGARAMIRSSRKEPDDIIADVFGLRVNTDLATWQFKISRTCSKSAKFFQHPYTNSSPYAVVASLEFIRLWHQDKSVIDIANSFITGEISMKKFLENYLPGEEGKTTQVALFLQGVKWSRAELRSELKFVKPESIIDTIVDDAVKKIAIKQELRKRATDRTSIRQEKRKENAVEFATKHTQPKLFTPNEVKKLNKFRPIDDQLELMPSGLLKHHCCYQDCDNYLKNMMTKRDRVNARKHQSKHTRHGIMNHLQYDPINRNYVQNYHVMASMLWDADFEIFKRKMDNHYKHDIMYARIEKMELHLKQAWGSINRLNTLSERL